MSEVLVGSAYALMLMKYEQFMTGASAVEQQIKRLQALTATPIVATVGLQGGGAGTPAAATPSRSTSGGDDALRQQRAIAALTAQQSQLARIQGDSARAAQLDAQAQALLTTALANQTPGTLQAIAVERQLASVQQQSAQAAKQNTNLAQEFGTAFKSNLLGIVGPAALVAGGFAAARAAVGSFVDAYKFTAQLDATNLSIRTQLGEVRNASAAFDEAATFGVRYRLTQQDTAQAVQASIPILRSSNASLTEVESTLLRLQSKKPEKSIADAARALDELKSGQIVSIVDQFNVSRDAANAMKNEIQGGADAVQVLSKYLADAGIGMDVLENRAKGAAGKLAELQQAEERRQQAQGGASGGVGAFLISAQIAAQDALTDALSGNAAAYAAVQARDAAYTQAKLEGKNSADAARIAHDAWALSIQKSNTTITETTTKVEALGAAFDDIRAPIGQAQIEAAAIRVGAAFDDERRAAAQLQLAIGAGITDLQRSANASALDTAQKKAQADQIAILNENTNASLNTFLALNPTLDASGAAAAAAAQGYAPIIGQLAAIKLQADGATASLAVLNAQQAGIAGLAKGLAGGAGSSVTTAFGGGAGSGVKRFVGAQADAEQLLDSQIQLAAAMGNTSKQIDLLRQKERQYAGTQAERNQIEAQIIGLQKSSGKTRVDAAATTGLQLAQTEQNSQAAILKAQREGQERLADSAADFALSRSRKQEDFERDYRKLLAQGQRARAADLKAEFDLSQKRAAEDFNISRSRTVRNNAESTGDIGDRTDLRQSQIGDRAALRGVRPGGGAPIDLGSAPPTLTGAGGRAGAPQPIIVRVQIAPTQVQIDGHAIVELTWPETEQRIDAELSSELSTIGIILPPGGGQTAVAGPRS